MNKLIILLLIVLSSCWNQPITTKYTYTVINKEKAVGSYYNFFTEKQVVETRYYIIAKDTKGKVVTHKCSIGEYYKYKIGKSYITESPW